MAESSVAGLLAADSYSVHISPPVSNRSEEETPVSSVSPSTPCHRWIGCVLPNGLIFFRKRKMRKVLLIQTSSSAAERAFSF